MQRPRAALRTALKDPDKEVQDAAARALWETRDPGLLPDLLSAAGQAPDLNGRVPAVRGYIRLVSDLEDNDLGPGERVQALAEIPALGPRRGKMAGSLRPGQGSMPPLRSSLP